MFLLDKDDGLYRLPSTKFRQMLRDPASCRLPHFAGARVRMVDVGVQLQDRKPLCVVWMTLGFLTFDRKGYFDATAFDRHQRARAELGLAVPIAETGGAGTVVDAANRFVAQGGLWAPSRILQRRIDATALGEIKCTLL